MRTPFLLYPDNLRQIENVRLWARQIERHSMMDMVQHGVPNHGAKNHRPLANIATPRKYRDEKDMNNWSLESSFDDEL
jgi:hypothetical protein